MVISKKTIKENVHEKNFNIKKESCDYLLVYLEKLLNNVLECTYEEVKIQNRKIITKEHIKSAIDKRTNILKILPLVDKVEKETIVEDEE